MSAFRIIVALVLWLLPLLATSSARAGDATARVVVLRIEPEIDCPGCEDRLKHILETAKGVRRVEMDVMESRASVRFDPAECTVGRLCGRVATTGYTAREVR